MPDANDPNINEYGISHDDWDDMSANEQRDTAHEHGEDWLGEPPPAQDDDGGSSKSTSSASTGAQPTFTSDAAQEAWLADQREKQWNEYERERQANVQKGRDDWSRQSKDRENRLRSAGRSKDADQTRQQRETQESKWNQEDEDNQDDLDRDRSNYVDRPSRQALIDQARADDTNSQRRKTREALANIYRQSSAAEIEEQLWYGWAWEDPPPPPSAARLAAATGPNAVPLFGESLDPMEKLGWETGEEYLERVETVQAWRDQLSNERALRESRGEQQFPGESDAAFKDRLAAMRQGPSEAPQSALGYALEQLNAQGLGPAEYAAALERLSRDPWFHGIAYDQERDWLAGKADSYRSVGHANDAWEGKVLGNINTFGSPEAQAQAQAVLGDGTLTREERRDALVKIQDQAWEGKVLGNIYTFGSPEAQAQAEAVLGDNTLTREDRRDALVKIEAQAWETKVLGSISAFGGEEALGRARGIQSDSGLTPEQRREALAGLQSETWETKVLGEHQRLRRGGSPGPGARDTERQRSHAGTTEGGPGRPTVRNLGNQGPGEHQRPWRGGSPGPGARDTERRQPHAGTTPESAGRVPGLEP